MNVAIEIAPKATNAMNHRNPSGEGRRQRLPYDWEIRKAKRRRITGRVAAGIIGLLAIAIFMLATNAFGAPV